MGEDSEIFGKETGKQQRTYVISVLSSGEGEGTALCKGATPALLRDSDNITYLC